MEGKKYDETWDDVRGRPRRQSVEADSYCSSNFLKIRQEDMEKFCKAVHSIDCSITELSKKCEELLNALNQLK